MNRQMKAVTLKSYTGQTQDALGALHDTYSDTSIKMAISTNSGSKLNSNSILYEDSTHIGITKAIVTVNDTVTEGDNTYTVDFVSSGSRYNQVFLKLVK
jgi:hypothetical protein